MYIGSYLVTTTMHLVMQTCTQVGLERCSKYSRHLK